MIVAVSASQPDPDSPVDPRFGRCPFYVLVDAESFELQTMENTAAMAGMGAGIQAAQAVVNAGADAVISGNFGPNAFQALSQAGVALFAAPPGLTVRQAVEALKAGQLTALTSPSVAAHFGMGGGRGRGMGGGMGAGRMGGPGMMAPQGPMPGAPMGTPGQQPPDQQITPEELKEQLDMLQEQLEALRRLVEGMNRDE